MNGVIISLLVLILLIILILSWQIKQLKKAYKIQIIRDVHTSAQYSFCDEEIIFSREEHIDYFPIKTLTHLSTITMHTPPIPGAYLDDKFSDMKIDSIFMPANKHLNKPDYICYLKPQFINYHQFDDFILKYMKEYDDYKVEELISPEAALPLLEKARVAHKV